MFVPSVGGSANNELPDYPPCGKAIPATRMNHPTNTCTPERNDPHHGPTRQQIRERAYELWERHHRPPGREFEFWLMAEHDLMARDGDEVQQGQEKGEPGDDA